MAQMSDSDYVQSRGMKFNVNTFIETQFQMFTYTHNTTQKKKKNANSIPVTHFHVSCRSDKLWETNENAGGVVIYQKDGKNDWYCNGVHCKSGYIIIKCSSSTDKVQVANDGSMIHNKVYKAVFGEAPDSTVIRGGFAWYKNQWKYNSMSCNTKSKFSDGEKIMNAIEIAEIKRTVKAWMDSKGKVQTVKCKEPLYINE